MSSTLRVQGSGRGTLYKVWGPYTIRYRSDLRHGEDGPIRIHTRTRHVMGLYCYGAPNGTCLFVVSLQTPQGVGMELQTYVYFDEVCHKNVLPM